MEPSHNTVDWYHFSTVHKFLGAHWLDKLAPVKATFETHPPRSKLYGSKDDDGAPISEPQLLIFDQFADSIKLFDRWEVPDARQLSQTRFCGPQNMATYLDLPKFGRFMMLLLMVPVAPFKTEMQIFVYYQKWWAWPLAQILGRILRLTLAQDREIWEHKTMHKTRNSIKGDWSWTAYDKWLRQFYSPGSLTWSSDLSW